MTRFASLPFFSFFFSFFEDNIALCRSASHLRNYVSRTKFKTACFPSSSVQIPLKKKKKELNDRFDVTHNFFSFLFDVAC